MQCVNALKKLTLRQL